MMKRKFLILIAALFALGIGLVGLRSRRGAVEIAAPAAKYYCPMHPSYISDRPGECPICNMSLVRMEEEIAPQISEDSPVTGQAAVTITPERRRLIGMKTEEVTYRSLSATVRASGRVAYDPDLYHAISEYREAVKTEKKIQDSPLPDVQARTEALVRASRLRLRQMGLSDAQIEEFGSGGASAENLLLGEPGGTVWVYAQVYEYEIGLIQSGQQAEIEAAAYPGRKFYGTVKAVDPILSAETRSLKVRIEVPNPKGLLKLEMYVNARIRAPLGRQLALPESAFIDTGERRLVFVDLGAGRIEPREVQLGREADGYYEILSGIHEGERVVTSANFLIDSESKLKAAIEKPGGKNSKEHHH